MSDYRNIAFGLSSAEAERTSDPDLLLNGYIDFRGAADEALASDKYLFLGYKGAGKSSIGERIELVLSGEFDRFVKLVSLSDFPFTPFSKIIRGDLEPEAKYTMAWSWIILIYILESFSRDEGLGHPDMPRLQDAIGAFRQMGLSPASDPASIVRTSVKTGFKLSLPGKLAEYSWSGSEIKPAADIPDFVESLKEILRDVRSDGKHYLIIDGLDDILTSREVQYKSLSALIFEVGVLNKMFKKYNVPAKIILLCRTDLFEKIPGANKNKIRQDNSVELDWYNDPRDPEHSMLVEIAELRAARSVGKSMKLFGGMLPHVIDGSDIRRYLLDMTRHTPRDFLQLLSNIQKFASGGRVSVDQIKSGMREYSIKYLFPEIRDELSGYATPEEISHVLGALGRLRKRDFKISELLDSSSKSVSKINESRVLEIVEVLFNCSALGNIQHRQGGNTYYTFKYRNRHSSFNDGEDIMLHRGLWKAMNLT